jgi:hypothetical protein
MRPWTVDKRYVHDPDPHLLMRAKKGQHSRRICFKQTAKRRRYGDARLRPTPMGESDVLIHFGREALCG